MSWVETRRIPVLLAAATLIPIGALSWLGMRTLQQDRELERQRRRERLEVAAGRLALDLERRLPYYYELLAHETERLHRMVESLLGFGRIDAGAYAWRMEPADVKQLVCDIVEEFRHEPLAKGRSVLCEIEEGLPPI